MSFWKGHSQREHSLLRAVQSGDVVWTGVVQHGVPVRKHLNLTGTNRQLADRIVEKQSHYGSSRALKQSGNMLEKGTRTGDDIKRA